MDVLLMRFEAPMMSFGAPMVDSRGVIQSYPGLSMLTGLFGNALGYRHSDADALDALQARLSYAVRRDSAGVKIRDYQTVDLGQDFMTDGRAWTTRHEVEKRAGGNSKGTHIREREYWAGAVYTVAVTLADGEQEPTLATLEHALNHPTRPLFIGRKPCIPSGPLSMGIAAFDDLKTALVETPLHATARSQECEVWWPVDEEVHTRDTSSRLVCDRRDWRNQIHTGQRWVAHSTIVVEGGRT